MLNLLSGVSSHKHGASSWRWKLTSQPLGRDIFIIVIMLPYLYCHSSYGYLPAGDTVTVKVPSRIPPHVLM
uniref:Uncharacterized protein n=1 Tax=Arion vulgaris TaxID=1028688 RepID=A0A0B7BHG3_9EUPU